MSRLITPLVAVLIWLPAFGLFLAQHCWAQEDASCGHVDPDLFQAVPSTSVRSCHSLSPSHLRIGPSDTDRAGHLFSRDWHVDRLGAGRPSIRCFWTRSQNFPRFSREAEAIAVPGSSVSAVENPSVTPGVERVLNLTEPARNSSASLICLDRSKFGEGVYSKTLKRRKHKWHYENRPSCQRSCS
jgi:hypothetical protein